MRKSLITAFVIITALVLLPSFSYAIHKGAGGLVCGGCHTMHNSQGGTSLDAPVGGAVGLLRGAVTKLGGTFGFENDSYRLCLQCHATNGAQADVAHQPHGQQAPKVFIDSSKTQWDQTMAFDKIGAGGNFYPELDDNWNFDPDGNRGLGRGHSIGAEWQPAPGIWACCTIAPSCTMCHSYHGITADSTDSLRFRNIRRIFANMSGIEMKSYIGGITGRFDAGGNYVPVSGVGGVKVWPVFQGDPTVPANNNAYDPLFGSRFCTFCHNKFHEDMIGANAAGEDWRRHPAGYVINDADVSGAGVDTIDYAHYEAIPDGYKVPVAYGDADVADAKYYMDNNNEDKVFCLTCHFAHGGPYYDNLRWDYNFSVAAGEQTSNPITSVVGCQQCHNR